MPRNGQVYLKQMIFTGLTDALVDSFFDRSETVAHAIAKALKDIARKKPLIVLNTSGNYLTKHVKVCIYLYLPQCADKIVHM